MNSKTYRVTLETLGPVHIGTGSTLTKQEFILEEAKRLIHIIDGRRLVNYLKRIELLEDYVAFWRNPEPQSGLGFF